MISLLPLIAYFHSAALLCSVCLCSTTYLSSDSGLSLTLISVCLVTKLTCVGYTPEGLQKKKVLIFNSKNSLRLTCTERL